MRLAVYAAGAALCLLIGFAAIAATSPTLREDHEEDKAPLWEGTFFGASYYRADDIDHMVARVQVGGDFIHADLGDRRRYDDDDIHFNIGEPVAFRGVLSKRDGKSWVRATEVTVDGHTYDLTDDEYDNDVDPNPHPDPVPEIEVDDDLDGDLDDDLSRSQSMSVDEYLALGLRK